MFQCPDDVGKEHPEGVGQGRPLALLRRPYEEIHRTTLKNVLDAYFC